LVDDFWRFDVRDLLLRFDVMDVVKYSGWCGVLHGV
jgi:hypothetical protein